MAQPEARPGYDAYDASEYLDEPAVLQESQAVREVQVPGGQS